MGWLANDWVAVVAPILILLAAAVLGLWSRIAVYRVVSRWQERVGWAEGQFVTETLWRPFFYWFLLFGTYISIQISTLSAPIKELTGNVVVSLFVLSLTWVAITLSTRFIKFYTSKAPQPLTLMTLNIVRVTVAVIVLFTILDIWGAPTEPILIFLVTGLFMGWLIFKDTIPNLIAGLEIYLRGQIKVGHVIKLESGETGSVYHTSWTNTTIKDTDGTMLHIPNKILTQGILVNYGHDTPSKTIDQSTKPLDILSDREKEVLSLIGKGSTNREIAEKLIVSEHTVKSHLRSILSKLNIRNRQQAAVYAEREGLVGAHTDSVKSDS